MRKFSEKSYLYYSKTSNTENVELFHVWYDKVALLMRKSSEWKTRYCPKRFLEWFGTYISVIENVTFYDSDETEIRLTFYKSFSTF